MNTIKHMALISIALMGLSSLARAETQPTGFTVPASIVDTTSIMARQEQLFVEQNAAFMVVLDARLRSGEEQSLRVATNRVRPAQQVTLREPAGAAELHFQTFLLHQAQAAIISSAVAISSDLLQSVRVELVNVLIR